MNYENTLAAYKALLESNPGHALHLGSSTVAILQEGKLLAAHVHAEGRIDLHKAFEFIEDAWDEDSECWANENSASETMHHITQPSFVKVVEDHQEALRALSAGEWDSPALVAVGPLAATNIERVRAVYAHYSLPSQF